MTFIGLSYLLSKRRETSAIGTDWTIEIDWMVKNGWLAIKLGS